MHASSYWTQELISSLGIVMFDNMSAKWAMATLGFVSFGLVALIYVLYFFGAKIRSMSKLARTL